MCINYFLKSEIQLYLFTLIICTKIWITLKLCHKISINNHKWWLGMISNWHTIKQVLRLQKYVMITIIVLRTSSFSIFYMPSILINRLEHEFLFSPHTNAMNFYYPYFTYEETKAEILIAACCWQDNLEFKSYQMKLAL